MIVRSGSKGGQGEGGRGSAVDMVRHCWGRDLGLTTGPRLTGSVSPSSRDAILGAPRCMQGEYGLGSLEGTDGKEKGLGLGKVG